jgi:transposase InsO family protein
MDFISGLPKFKGFEIILVIMDRLTKFVYFLPLKHPYTVVTIANTFFHHVYQNHGLPTSLITDRDPVFTSRFWKELMLLLGIQLNMSSVYHPQTDGQTKRVN